VSEANRIKPDAPKRCGSCLTASYADAELAVAGVMTKAGQRLRGACVRWAAALAALCHIGHRHLEQPDRQRQPHQQGLFPATDRSRLCGGRRLYRLPHQATNPNRITFRGLSCPEGLMFRFSWSSLFLYLERNRRFMSNLLSGLTESRGSRRWLRDSRVSLDKQQIASKSYTNRWPAPRPRGAASGPT